MRGFRWGVGSLLVVACLDGLPPSVVARVDITAPDTAGVLGRTLMLDVTAYDAGGTRVAPPPLFWSSLDSMRAHFDSTGRLVLGPQAGDAAIVVRTSIGVSDTQWVHAAYEGEVKWKLPMAQGKLNSVDGPALGPDGTVYVLNIPFPAAQNVSDLYAITPGGDTLWVRRLSETNSSAHLVGPDGTIYVAGAIVHAVTPQGATLWDHPISAQGPALSGAIRSGTALLLAAEDLFALDPATGDTAWVAARSGSGAWVVPPTITHDTLWAKKSADSVYTFAVTTGALRALRMPDPDSGRQVSFGAGPVPVGGLVYVPSAYQLAAFDMTGARVWSTPQGGLGVSEPAFDAAGGLYVQTTGDGLLALDAETGHERWRAGIPSRWAWYGGPAVAQGGVVYAAAGGGFYAYDTSGVLLWQAHEGGATPGPFTGAPAIAADGTVYSYTDTCVYAFWASHPPEPNSPWPMWRHDARRSGVAR
jgi:outer membrane protein assembly factor BamB